MHAKLSSTHVSVASKDGACGQAEYDVFSHELPLPDMPPKRSWQPPQSQPPGASTVPTPSQGVLNDQPPAQRQRLETETTQARQAEQDLAKVGWHGGRACACSGSGLMSLQQHLM